jgi:hypothetical protein
MNWLWKRLKQAMDGDQLPKKGIDMRKWQIREWRIDYRYTEK